MDHDTEGNTECKLSKSIKRSLSKALLKLDTSKGHLKEIKSKLYLNKKSKRMLKFYKKEMEFYDQDIMTLPDNCIYA